MSAAVGTGVFLAKVFEITFFRDEIGIGLVVHEGIVCSIERPGSAGDLRKFDEAPMALEFVADTEVITDGGGDIDAGILIFGIKGF